MFPRRFPRKIGQTGLSVQAVPYPLRRAQPALERSRWVVLHPCHRLRPVLDNRGYLRITRMTIFIPSSELSSMQIGDQWRWNHSNNHQPIASNLNPHLLTLPNNFRHPHPHSTLHPNQRRYTDDTGSYTFSTAQYPRAAPSNSSNSGFVFKIVSRLH